jgi:hypothetical protein
MNRTKWWLGLALSLLIAGTSLAQGQAPKGQAAAKDNANISAPGPTGGSCSATSTDGNKTCSISCGTGKSALCSNTKTTVSCRCGG